MPSEIPLETLRELYRAFCLARFSYDGAYVDEQAREQHLDNDARSYWFSHVHDDEKTPLSVLVDAAFRAGRESAYTRDEWRVVAVDPYTQKQVINTNAVNELTGRVLLKAARSFDPDAWLEHRRTGATDWQRVDQVGERQQSETVGE